jgi:hypothetical protein
MDCAVMDCIYFNDVYLKGGYEMDAMLKQAAIIKFKCAVYAVIIHYLGRGLNVQRIADILICIADDLIVSTKENK